MTLNFWPLSLFSSSECWDFRRETPSLCVAEYGTQGSMQIRQSLYQPNYILGPSASWAMVSLSGSSGLSYECGPGVTTIGVTSDMGKRCSCPALRESHLIGLEVASVHCLPPASHLPVINITTYFSDTSNYFLVWDFVVCFEDARTLFFS